MEPQSVVLKEVVALAQRALISTHSWMDCFSLFPDRVDWGNYVYTESGFSQTDSPGLRIGVCVRRVL